MLTGQADAPGRDPWSKATRAPASTSNTSMAASHTNFTTGSSGSTAMSINSYRPTAGAPGSGSASSRASISSLSTFPASTLSASASLAASATGSPGCPGTPQCVLVTKGFSRQGVDANWAYCNCSGSPAPLTASWMGSLVIPNCDYSTIPPSQCPGSSVIPYAPTESAASIVEVDGSLVVIHSHMKRAIPATSLSSASHAVTSGAPQSFNLTVSATLPCPGPIVSAVPCGDNYIPPFTSEQWYAHNVDEFWQMYVDNKSHWQTSGLMTTFFRDFAGGLNGNGNQYQCRVDNEVDCLQMGCSAEATGPESWLTPYKIQAYYIWAGMTGFSKIMNMVWQALEWAGQDIDSTAIVVGSKFKIAVPKTPILAQIFSIVSALLVIVAVAFIIADPVVDILFSVSLRRLLCKITKKLNMHI